MSWKNWLLCYYTVTLFIPIFIPYSELYFIWFYYRYSSFVFGWGLHGIVFAILLTFTLFIPSYLKTVLCVHFIDWALILIQCDNLSLLICMFRPLRFKIILIYMAKIYHLYNCYLFVPSLLFFPVLMFFLLA